MEDFDYCHCHGKRGKCIWQWKKARLEILFFDSLELWADNYL